MSMTDAEMEAWKLYRGEAWKTAWLNFIEVISKQDNAWEVFHNLALNAYDGYIELAFMEDEVILDFVNGYTEKPDMSSLNAEQQASYLELQSCMSKDEDLGDKEREFVD